MGNPHLLSMCASGETRNSSHLSALDTPKLQSASTNSAHARKRKIIYANLIINVLNFSSIYNEEYLINIVS